MRTMLAGMCLSLLAAAPDAHAAGFSGLWNPFRTPVERWAQQASEARQRGELDLAQSILDEAERGEGVGHAPLVHERGLLARDRGRLADAAELLGRAADLDPTSEARVEQAAVLVPLGRWPEAVERLQRAFDERGASLRADDVLVDPRFAPLVGFAPFQDLIRRVRADQSGPLGRLLLKFQHIDDRVRANHSVLEVLGRWLEALGRLGAYAGTAVVALLALGLLLSFGVWQTGLVQPPWTLVTGMSIAALLWYLGARIMLGTGEGAGVTVITALLVIFVPWGLAIAGRSLWRRRERERSLDPLDSVHLPQTLVLVAQVQRLATAALGGSVVSHRKVVRELRQTAETLRDRLAGLPAEQRSPREVVSAPPSASKAKGAAAPTVEAGDVASVGPAAVSPTAPGAAKVGADGDVAPTKVGAGADPASAEVSARADGSGAKVATSADAAFARADTNATKASGAPAPESSLAASPPAGAGSGPPPRPRAPRRARTPVPRG
jgi:tetratricopeptide (TPR) repeat protein